jgi:catechol 2,3-dioxygenase-like lactoylglutathione lyase family enzyme
MVLGWAVRYRRWPYIVPQPSRRTGSGRIRCQQFAIRCPNSARLECTMEQRSPGGLSAIVAMIQVADVERSVAFYRWLGFDVGHRVPPTGPMGWAWLYSPDASDWKRGPNVMLSRAECPIAADAQQVLFYLYAQDLSLVRSTLLAHGVAVSEITYPEYLPSGECQVKDPDGYTLMIAQSAPDTP